MKIYKRTQNLLYTSVETANAGLSDLTEVFFEVASRNIENIGKKNGNLDLTLVYHKDGDERKAEKAAEKESCDKLNSTGKSVKFVRVNEETIKGLVSDKKLKEQSVKGADADKKDKSRIKTLIEFIIAMLSFAAAIPSFLTFIQNNKLILGILMGIAIVVGAAFAVLSVFDLIKVVKRKKLELDEVRKTLDVSAAYKWEKDDFVYKTQNVIYVYFCFSEGDPYWQAFKRYLECLPRQISLSCVIFKRRINSKNDPKFFIDIFNGNKEKGCDSDKAEFEQINKDKKAKVFGYSLLPLTEEEKRQLVEELRLSRKYVSQGIANGGRDSLYRLFDQDGNFLDETNYFNLVKDIHNSISDNSQLTVDGVKKVLSFLSTLKNILTLIPRNINVAGGSESGMFLNSKILQEMNAELLESNENALKNTICFIWKTWQTDLISLADREYSLLVSEDSEDLNLSPYKWAIESFLNYLDYQNSVARNEYYYAVSSEIHLVIELIKSWHEVNNKTSMAGYFASSYLDVLKNILKLNSANGLYGYNYELLKFIRQVIFLDTRSTANDELLSNVNGFYVSEPVKAAFMQNAVVVPKTFDGDIAPYVGNMSNECREMHKTYLADRSEILSLEYAEEQAVPVYFELFGTRENSAEYYSLLRANDEQCVLDFFAALYNICDSLAKINIKYFRYLKIKGEVGANASVKRGLISNAVEKLSLCLFTEGQGDLLKDMLSGRPTGEELLSCGLLNCDVFFLLHDLYLLEQHAKQFVFSDSISSKSYNFIDGFLCVESLNKRDVNHRFSNMFTDLVKLITESGRVSFFAKYFLSIANIAKISSINIYIIRQWLSDYSELEVEINEDCQINNDVIREILCYCYNIKVGLGKEKLAEICPFVKTLPSKGSFAEEAECFVRFAIFEENVSFKDESAEIKFVEKLKTFSDVFCFLIISQVQAENVNLLKHIYLVADKIARTTYVNNMCILIQSLKYIDETNKEGVIRTIVDKINYNVSDIGVLKNYNYFFVENRSVIDGLKSDGYVEDKLNAINLSLTTMNYKQSLDLYYHLNKDAGFLFLYAKNLLENMCILRAKSRSNTETDVNKAYSEITSLELTFEENGIRYISQDYLSVVNAIATGKLANIDRNVKLKIIGDLILLLDTDDKNVTIDKAVRQKHKRLLSSISDRI